MNTSTFPLDLQIHPQTGQLLLLRDPADGTPLLACEEGPEFAWNDAALHTTLLSEHPGKGEHLTIMEALIPIGYGAAVRLRIRRMISLSGVGLRPGGPRSVHIRHEVTRLPLEPDAEGMDYIWHHPLEAPCRLDTFTVFAAPQKRFGQATRIRSYALGGTGPREHVSLEDGSLAEVVPWLQTPFRSEFPGQLTVNGALYYHADTHQWVWNCARRPTTTGRLLVDEQRHAYRFGYHMDFTLQTEVWAPPISLYWGKGLDEADRTFAHFFDRYEEPPDWYWKSVWFWLHPPWTRGVDYKAAAEGVRILSGECGVNGYGIFAHDLPPSGNDCDMHSPAPSPVMGGESGFRTLMDTIHTYEAHSYVWISRHGFRPDSLRFRSQWGVQGMDGRPIRIRGLPDRGVSLDILNPADPDFRRYIQEWIRNYVVDYGITGLFWDSGYQPIPPDFGNKPYLRWPGETNAHCAPFYEDMLRFGKSLSPDFFMWAEGISTEIPMNMFSVDARKHGLHSANRFMQRIAHLGPRRLMWRSHWKHDLASAFVMLNPMNDVGLTFADYKRIATDPMNQWICSIVRDRGVRGATGLADGISRLDEFIVASPGVSGTVIVADAPAQRLTHVITGESVSGTPSDSGTVFDLPAEGAYTF